MHWDTARIGAGFMNMEYMCGWLGCPAEHCRRKVQVHVGLPGPGTVSRAGGDGPGVPRQSRACRGRESWLDELERKCPQAVRG